MAELGSWLIFGILIFVAAHKEHRFDDRVRKIMFDMKSAKGLTTEIFTEKEIHSHAKKT